jgi:hypothetical protein
VGVITLPLVPYHQGRGNELLDPPKEDSVVQNSCSQNSFTGAWIKFLELHDPSIYTICFNLQNPVRWGAIKAFPFGSRI